eukprot:5226522-Amphidinium_carterae.1
MTKHSSSHVGTCNCDAAVFESFSWNGVASGVWRILGPLNRAFAHSSLDGNLSCMWSSAHSVHALPTIGQIWFQNCMN